MTTDMDHPGFLRRMFYRTWLDLAPLVRPVSTKDGEGAEGTDGISLSRREADLWSLVLEARGVPHRVGRTPGGYSVQVQEWFRDRAVEELSLYFSENRAEPVPGPWKVAGPAVSAEPTLAALGLLVLFYLFYNRYFPDLGWHPELWLRLGSADAAKTLAGQWWRPVTALTLHGGGPHLLSNVLIGGVFIWLAVQRLGSGTVWFLTMISGIMGNLVNSLVLGPPHNAIGFSTATFGAAGLLAAMAPFGTLGREEPGADGGWLRRAAGIMARGVVPFGAGLGLLAMLGSSRETDLTAHLFGFVWGVALGLAAGFLTLGKFPGTRLDRILYLAALALPIISWVAAWLACPNGLC